MDCKFYGVLSELVFIVGHLIEVLSFCRYVRQWRTRYLLALRAIDICSLRSHSICCFATRYKTPTVCRYVATQLDIWSRCDHSIYFSLRSKFDMLPSATRVDCAALCYLSRVARWATHIERFSAISSRRHIERRVSGAYRRRVDV